MKIKNLLMETHSRDNTAEIIAFVGTNSSRFSVLVNCLLSEDNWLAGRAAWVLSELAVSKPLLVRTRLADIIKLLTTTMDAAVKRNTLRILMSCATDNEEDDGILMNFCFDVVASYSELPGTKANALTVLDNLSGRYPEIRQELLTIIKERFDNESPAFRSRAKKISAGYHDKQK